MAMLTDNRPTREYAGATAQREAAEARQAAKRASEEAIARAHEAPGGGPQPRSSMRRELRQDGSVGVG